MTNPPLPGPLSFVMKQGSNPYWLSVLVVDHGNPLNRVEMSMAGRDWQSLQHADYDNSWISQHGVGAGPFTVRLTDNAGHVTTVHGVTLALEQVQRSSTWMYSGSARQSPPPATTGKNALAPTGSPAPLPPTVGSPSPAPPTSMPVTATSSRGYVPAAAAPSVRVGC